MRKTGGTLLWTPTLFSNSFTPRNLTTAHTSARSVIATWYHSDAPCRIVHYELQVAQGSSTLSSSWTSSPATFAQAWNSAEWSTKVPVWHWNAPCLWEASTSWISQFIGSGQTAISAALRRERCTEVEDSVTLAGRRVCWLASSLRSEAAHWLAVWLAGWTERYAGRQVGSSSGSRQVRSLTGWLSRSLARQLFLEAARRLAR